MRVAFPYLVLRALYLRFPRGLLWRTMPVYLLTVYLCTRVQWSGLCRIYVEVLMSFVGGDIPLYSKPFLLLSPRCVGRHFSLLTLFLDCLLMPPSCAYSGSGSSKHARIPRPRLSRSGMPSIYVDSCHHKILVVVLTQGAQRLIGVCSLAPVCIYRRKCTMVLMTSYIGDTHRVQDVRRCSDCFKVCSSSLSHRGLPPPSLLTEEAYP